MLGKILAISINTFREAIRNKILYSILIFSIGLIFFSLVLGKLSLGQQVRITIDLGLFCISFFGVIISVFIGVNLLYREVEKKTLYTVITKPIHRFQFILGKYFGVLFTLFTQILLMGVFLIALLYFTEQVFFEEIFTALFLIFLEILIVSAIAIFFSSFCGPFLSGAFTLLIYIFGRLSDTLLNFFSTADLNKVKSTSVGVYYLKWVADKLLEVIAWILPDLSKFYITDKIIQQVPIQKDFVFSCIGYTVSYVIVVLILSTLIFNRRDLV